MVLRCDWFLVPERGWDVHAHLQPHLHDASDWSLERVSPVSRSNAARLSAQYVGRHK